MNPKMIAAAKNSIVEFNDDEWSVY